jgi:NADH:ubiquinone oxidoreductase subunit F (NADH-binding)
LDETPRHPYQRRPASPQDVDLLFDVASQIKGKCLCALGEFSIEAVLSGLNRFRPDFDARVAGSDPGTGTPQLTPEVLLNE